MKKYIDIEGLARHIKKREEAYRNRIPIDLGPFRDIDPDEAAAAECQALIEMLRLAWKNEGPVAKFIKQEEGCRDSFDFSDGEVRSIEFAVAEYKDLLKARKETIVKQCSEILKLQTENEQLKKEKKRFLSKLNSNKKAK